MLPDSRSSPVRLGNNKQYAQAQKPANKPTVAPRTWPPRQKIPPNKDGPNCATATNADKPIDTSAVPLSMSK